MEVLTRWFGAERPLSQRDPEFSLSRSSANSGPFRISQTCWSRLGLVSRTDVNDAVATNRATAESWWSSKPRGQARETGASQPEGGGTQRRQPRKSRPGGEDGVREDNGQGGEWW